MTFDPESLYAKPKPGRGVRPALFVAGGVLAIGSPIAMLTSPFWWSYVQPYVWSQPQEQAKIDQPIKSQNSSTKSPIQFQEHYTPAVYAPPAAPSPTDPAPAATPAPAAAQPRPSGPPKKKGIPEEERVSSVISSKNQSAAAPPSNAPAPVSGGIQQVADTRGGREGFYGAAGQMSDAFKPTGIVAQLGRCALRPGSYIFHEAAGVVSSSTPGQITARTSRPLYAGPKGDCYASPAGATLVGSINANTSYGDERIQVAWTALILPNGRMVNLAGMPGAGGDGATGLAADVNNHFGALAGAVLAGTAVDVIRGMASFGGGGNGSDVVVNLGGALADRSASVAERLVDRELNRRPTLTAKQEELTVQVTRPIEMEPYRD